MPVSTITSVSEELVFTLKEVPITLISTSFALMINGFDLSLLTEKKASPFKVTFRSLPLNFFSKVNVEFLLSTTTDASGKVSVRIMAPLFTETSWLLAEFFCIISMANQVATAIKIKIAAIRNQGKDFFAGAEL